MGTINPVPKRAVLPADNRSIRIQISLPFAKVGSPAARRYKRCNTCVLSPSDTEFSKSRIIFNVNITIRVALLGVWIKPALPSGSARSDAPYLEEAALLAPKPCRLIVLTARIHKRMIKVEVRESPGRTQPYLCLLSISFLFRQVVLIIKHFQCWGYTYALVYGHSICT